LPATSIRSQNPSDASVAFGESLSAGIGLTLFSDDKPDRFFTVIKFWMDENVGLHWHSKLAFLPIKSRSACRAEGPPPRACGVTSFAGGGRKAELIC
jgi:hypothetical protein